MRICPSCMLPTDKQGICAPTATPNYILGESRLQHAVCILTNPQRDAQPRLGGSCAQRERRRGHDRPRTTDGAIRRYRRRRDRLLEPKMQHHKRILRETHRSKSAEHTAEPEEDQSIRAACLQYQRDARIANDGVNRYATRGYLRHAAMAAKPSLAPLFHTWPYRVRHWRP